MDLWSSSLFFILGLVFGSFYQVVGLRVPEKRSFVKGRSHCPHCKKQLHWYELIPIFSYVFQRGRCNECKEKISPLYPLMEIFTGFLFMISFITFQFSIELLIALLLMSLLIIIFVTDLNYMVIPNRILMFFAVPLVLLRILKPLDPWWS